MVIIGHLTSYDIALYTTIIIISRVRYCLPIIHGFVSINQVIIAGSKLGNGYGHRRYSTVQFFVVWSIISRRSTERCGTRLFVRGGDENGWVANYVETEQIVEFNGMTASFVQTRGSIPLLWQQVRLTKVLYPLIFQLF